MTLVYIGFILILIIIVGIIFINTAPQFGAKTTRDSYERNRKSENFKNGKFRDIEKTETMTKTDRSSLLKFFIKGETVPNCTIPVVKSSFTEENALTAENNVKVTWFGHSAILLEMNNRRIFFDPMLGKVPAPLPGFVSRRFNEELPMEIEDIPELDAVLVSHDHYDHLDYWSIRMLKDRVKKFYVPLGVAEHLKFWGVDESKIVELDWWDEVKFEELEITCTPSRHFSGRGLTNRDSTLWCSWIVKAENANIFFSGDTGYSDAFKIIGNKFGPFDLTLLECGQYNEGWAEIHMMPEQTVQAHIDLKGEILMPIHWGAFKLSIHPWQEPVERLLAEADFQKVKVTTPMIGEPVILGKTVPATRWWEKINNEKP